MPQAEPYARCKGYVVAFLWKGIRQMHSHIGAGFIIAALAVASPVMAQPVRPPSGSTTAAVAPPKWMTQEAAGQWRASKLIGLTVYNHDNEKIGGITELIVDDSGKLDAVVVGAGGLLGLGERDVAIPYDQITWMYLPGPQSPTNAPISNGLVEGTDRNLEGAHPAADKAFMDAARTKPYPDHAVIKESKEQLKTAPAFKYSR
jgi:sporulation protein YlmC with PRC-barrel domain